MPNDSLPSAPSGEEQTETMLTVEEQEAFDRFCEFADSWDEGTEEALVTAAVLKMFARLASLSTERARMLREMAEQEGELSDAEADNARLTSELEEWTEREAKVCPEDVGFDEFIGRLTSELDRVRTENERFREALVDIANPIGYLRRLCEIEGKVLHGAGAVQFASSASALQEIATKALGVTPDATTRREG